MRTLGGLYIKTVAQSAEFLTGVEAHHGEIGKVQTGSALACLLPNAGNYRRCRRSSAAVFMIAAYLSLPSKNALTLAASSDYSQNTTNAISAMASPDGLKMLTRKIVACFSTDCAS